MRIMVTGSSGMIGTRLCESLLEAYEVVPVDLRHNRWNSQLDRTTEIADLRDKDCLGNLSGGVDMIIHCAANARVHALSQVPDLALDNLLMVHNVLEHARSFHIPRIVFTSSREVYGSVSDGSPVGEEPISALQCESPYAASKVAAEAWLHSYCRVYGISFVIVRLSNVYGMYDASDRLVPLWLQRISRAEPVEVYGADKELDFTYIDDAMDGILRVVQGFDLVQNQAVNIASGRSTRLVEVARIIGELVGQTADVIIKENRPGEILSFKADISKAGRMIGYSPLTDIRHGLMKTVAWYEAHSLIPSGLRKLVQSHHSPLGLL